MKRRPTGDQRVFGLLLAAAISLPPILCSFPSSAFAQDEEGEAAEEAIDEELPGDEEPGLEELPDGTPGGEGLEDICEIDPAACPHLDMKKEAARPLDEQIYAVQQLFIIKARRFETQLAWTITFNDQFVDHPAPAAALNYYFSNVLAVGLNFNYYRPFNTDKDFNHQVRRSARVSVPLTEYDWGAAFNFTYVPAMGKFAAFSDFIFHYDAYVVGGVGALSTRPIPVIDPDNRNFEFEPKIAFNAGIGLKIFVNRWFAATLEFRDYIFLDQLENLETGTTAAELQDRATWLGETKLTNNVQLQFGVAVFLPFSFEYRLPK